MKRFLIIIGIFLLPQLSFSQPYGNEWVNLNQSYYKMKIAEDGIYKLSFSDLNSVGINLSSINPQNISIFYRGEEQHIYVFGEADGRFDQNDFIYFYAEHNDGKADSTLYPNPADIPHNYYSLLTDTATYFLTIGNSSGKRIQKFNGTAISGTPEPYYIHEQLELYTNNYYRGAVIAGRAYRSDFTSAEGWFGQEFRRGNSYDLTVSSEFLVQSGPNPNVEMVVLGNSNETTPFLDNHHLKISVGPNTANLSQIADLKYRNYGKELINTSVLPNNLGLNNTIFRFEVIDDLMASRDNNTIGYIKLTYPRSFDLANSSQRKMNLVGNFGTNRLNFSNYGKSNPMLFDLTNNLLIDGNFTVGNFDVMVPNGGTDKKLFLIDESEILNTSLEQAIFNNNVSALNYDFIIITHESLKNKATDFANYRASASGGNHNPLLITTEELYNQFYYGLHHPMAIRQMMKFLFDNQATAPEYLFLIGKGYQTQLVRDSEYFNKDLVPTVGVIGSDNLLTYRINGNNFDPALAIGRLSARNEQEIQNYLDKVIEYETGPPSPWCKEVFSATGGNNLSETLRFGAYMDDFNNNLSSPSLGANITLYEKDINEAQPIPPKEVLIREINEGKLILNYYGHGSAFNTAINVGDPSEYSNKGKYPFMYFSGCLVGDAFNESSLGEVFMVEPDAGAIGWLAQSNLGYESFLHQLGKVFTRRIAQDNYGESVGLIVKKSLEEFHRSDDLNIIHVQQHTYQGDPSIKLCSFDNPDYTINSNDIFVKGANSCKVSTSFQLGIVLNNHGKATADSVEIQVLRTNPNMMQQDIPIQKFPAVFSKDTIYVTISTLEVPLEGFNTFQVIIDPLNKILELNESNNSATLEYFAPLNVARPVSPKPYSIVSNTQVKISAQNMNLFSNGANYTIQIDSTKDFSSPFVQTLNLVGQNANAGTIFNLPNTDSTVYYWRVKIDTAKNWCNSSFTYFNGSPSGWNQSDFGQFENIKLENVTRNDTTEKFSFIKDKARITVRMNRFLTPAYNLGIRDDDFLLSGGSICGSLSKGTEFDKRQVTPFQYSTCSGTRSAKPFAVQTANGRAELIQYIKDMPTGNHFAYVTFLNGADFLKLDSLPFYLAQLGADINILNALGPNHAYVLIGTKGASLADVVQDSSYSQTNQNEDLANVEKCLSGYWYKGCLKSEKIGPANNWTQFSYQLSDPNDSDPDSLRFNIIGIDVNGIEKTLFSNINSSPFPLNSIDAKIYPFIRLEACFEDLEERSIPQLKRWTVLFGGTPEGTILIDSAFAFPTKTLRQNDTLLLTYKFKNISTFTTDSLIVSYFSVDSAGNTQVLGTEKIDKIVPNQEILLNFKHAVSGMAGNNLLTYSVLPEDSTRELILENNSQVLAFNVNNDPTPVEMLFFKANLVQEDVELTWATSQEINNHYFEIQRRHENENQFTSLAKINGAGTTSEVQNYFYPDDVRLLTEGLLYYRLKQFDYDGSFEYSEIRTIDLSKKYQNQIEIYPVPAQEYINFKFILKEDSDVKIQLYNSLGQLAKPAMILNNLHEGISEKTVELKNLAHGTYTVKIIFSDEEVHFRKLIIQ